MRTRVLAVFALLLAWATDALAQENPAGWSVQVGTGIIPYHMTLIPTRSTLQELARSGQSTGTIHNPYGPALSLSGSFRRRKWTEFRFTLGGSWRVYEITQYSVFGTDPDGKPRYDLTDSHPAGTRNDSVFSFTLECFHIWNPGRTVELYSGGGLGLLAGSVRLINEPFLPLPEITPIGARFGRGHLYGFLELTIGPITTLGHGGVGWRF